jgi:hypothetical protein
MLRNILNTLATVCLQAGISCIFKIETVLAIVNSTDQHFIICNNSNNGLSKLSKKEPLNKE